MHLAQFNIAYPKYSLEDPRMADFMDNLEFINGIAENMPGFVWRLKDESGNATGLETPFGAEAITNMSVWESPEELEYFVWNTVHKKFYNRKNEWFEAIKSNYMVMWWVDERHEPTLAEARERLEHLNENGNSDYAFDWAHPPHVKLWQEQRCG